MSRQLTEQEQRGLSQVQQQYLLANPGIQCLQPGELASTALYQTVRHGAVTIDRAIELDEMHSRVLAEMSRAKQARGAAPAPFDDYTAEEDRFIDRSGMSSRLS